MALMGFWNVLLLRVERDDSRDAPERGHCPSLAPGELVFGCFCHWSRFVYLRGSISNSRAFLLLIHGPIPVVFGRVGLDSPTQCLLW
ncbi:hypothetical protein F9C07_1342 [Aspergillus flavus]|uniref:Uncharacterized protein n=1 Tax=Aspergillus flavus (strain ATCC 200026 / FGSC A1120 / IAM 13836 / NRRL 3357 / JCM 12722 / SRRC 167) TaxID=332952 RepID=A0A7U2QXZ3_ASPFN|nr:hypothetical protein F9C07_1342 [Aspergillus flavus]